MRQLPKGAATRQSNYVISEETRRPDWRSTSEIFIDGQRDQEKCRPDAMMSCQLHTTVRRSMHDCHPSEDVARLDGYGCMSAEVGPWYSWKRRQQ